MGDYLDRTVQKLHVKYGKDELVSHLKKAFTISEVRRGKDAAYIDELEYELEKTKEELEVFRSKYDILMSKNPNQLSKMKHEDLYRDLLKQHKKLRTEAKRLESTNAELIYKLNNKKDA